MCAPFTRTTEPPPTKPTVGEIVVTAAGLRKRKTTASSPFKGCNPPAPTAKNPSFVAEKKPPRGVSVTPKPDAGAAPQVISPCLFISPGAAALPTTHFTGSPVRSVAPKTESTSRRPLAPPPVVSPDVGTTASTGSAETYSYHTSSPVYPAPVRAPTATRDFPTPLAGATHSSVDACASPVTSPSRASRGPTLPIRHAAGSTPTKFSPVTEITVPPLNGPPFGKELNTRGVARIVTVIAEALVMLLLPPPPNSTVAIDPGAK
mmetsp:Transcript_8160/g.30594  ORF Transcript_8160/g.30594 Transcript_8160/m.30594 type:complete len:262 (+) Transcript_8160:8706-9491(+)